MILTWALISLSFKLYIYVAQDRDQRRQHHRKAALREEFQGAEAGQPALGRDQGTLPQMQGDLHATAYLSLIGGAFESMR